MLKFKVKNDETSKRADVVISQHLSNYSRSSLKQLFVKTLVFVNGVPAKASRKLEAGDFIDVDTALLESQPEHIKIPIIYEDEDVIVINKPTGVLTHSKGALNTEATVASFIGPKLRDKNLTGNRAGVVHRLDRATNGVMICAKNDQALQWLQKQFSTRKVKKTYLAIIEGSLDPSEAIIDAPIERNPKKPQTFRVSLQGKPARTKYKVLKNFDKDKKVYSLLELNPQTGRTHQLRVHLKYIGHPIVGDFVYGKGDGSFMLHAKSLELILPSGEKRIFAVNPPKSFNNFISS